MERNFVPPIGTIFSLATEVKFLQCESGKVDPPTRFTVFGVGERQYAGQIFAQEINDADERVKNGLITSFHVNSPIHASAQIIGCANDDK